LVGEAGPWAAAAAGQPPKPGPPVSPSSWIVTPCRLAFASRFCHDIDRIAPASAIFAVAALANW
jgi:hypothetical protein